MGAGGKRLGEGDEKKTMIGMEEEDMVRRDKDLDVEWKKVGGDGIYGTQVCPVMSSGVSESGQV